MSSTATTPRRAGSHGRATSKRARRRDMRARTRRRVRGGENLGPLWMQRSAQTALVGTHRVRSWFVRVFAGDRPFVLGLLGLLAVGVLVVSGPLNAYLDQRAQLELLEQQVAVLGEANDGLAERALRLRQDEAVELLAREEFGLVRPGEVAYVVVPPEQERPEIVDRLEVDVAPRQSRLEAVWSLLTDWFG